MHPRFFTAPEIRDLLSPAQATEAITRALCSGLDPSTDTPRGIVGLERGQFLVMPAERSAYAGIKIATVAPNNPSRELPRVQALYLLFDSDTLTPQAILDGTELTAVRTPAVSIAAVLPALLHRTEPLQVAVFGAGRQGIGHIETLAGVLRGHRSLQRVSYIVRNPLSCLANDPGRSAVAPSAIGEVLQAGSTAAEGAVAAADVIICATSASEPLFDSRMLRNDSIVIAVGSHEPHVREVDAALCGRAQVVVEDVATALRESGDIVMAIAEGTLSEEELVPMKDLLTGAVPLQYPDRPLFFKSSGMSWEDLVAAAAVVEASLACSA